MGFNPSTIHTSEPNRPDIWRKAFALTKILGWPGVYPDFILATFVASQKCRGWGLCRHLWGWLLADSVELQVWKIIRYCTPTASLWGQTGWKMGQASLRHVSCTGKHLQWFFVQVKKICHSLWEQIIREEVLHHKGHFEKIFEYAVSDFQGGS